MESARQTCGARPTNKPQVSLYLQMFPIRANRKIKKMRPVGIVCLGHWGLVQTAWFANLMNNSQVSLKSPTCQTLASREQRVGRRARIAARLWWGSHMESARQTCGARPTNKPQVSLYLQMFPIRANRKIKKMRPVGIVCLGHWGLVQTAWFANLMNNSQVSLKSPTCQTLASRNKARSDCIVRKMPQT